MNMRGPNEDADFQTKSEVAIKELIRTLTLSAKERQEVAFRFLLACFVLVAIGLLVFTYANQLTNTESIQNTFNRLRASDAGLETLRKKAAEIEGDYRVLQYRIDSINQQIDSGKLSLPDVQKSNFFILRDILQRPAIASRKDWIDDMHVSNLLILVDAEKVIDDVKKFDAAVITYEFFSALSTRVGSIIIIFFLVQVLIRIYRYNTRLSNYYKARADALTLHLQDVSLPLDKLIEVLSPDSLDIGITKAPWDQMAEIVRQAQSKKPGG